MSFGIWIWIRIWISLRYGRFDDCENGYCFSLVLLVLPLFRLLFLWIFVLFLFLCHFLFKPFVIMKSTFYWIVKKKNWKSKEKESRKKYMKNTSPYLFNAQSGISIHSHLYKIRENKMMSASNSPFTLLHRLYSIKCWPPYLHTHKTLISFDIRLRRQSPQRQQHFDGRRKIIIKSNNDK